MAEQAADTTGSGTDTLDIKQIDPNAGRKAIIAKHNAVQQAEREIDVEQVPGAKTFQSGYDQGEVAMTADGDTAGGNAVQSARAAVEPEAAPVVASAQAPPEMVTLKVFGKEITEPKDKVEAAGGVDARQAQIASEIKFQNAQAEAQDAERLQRVAREKAADYNARLNKLTQPAAKPAPAAPAARPAVPTDSRPAAETTAAAGEVDPDIANLVTVLYAGDPAESQKALAEVLRKSRSAGVPPPIDVEGITALVQAKVDSDLAARDAHNAVEEQRRKVNDLMATQYQAVLTDPALRADCAHLYNAAVADPRNQGRPWVVIADEVAQRVLGRAGHVEAPNADVQQEVNTRTNFKRRIPQPSQASERVPAAAAESRYPTKGSDVVNMMRAARHQPPQ
jgi:hypothetical protein